jgi:nitrite reductase (NO-forming)
MMIRTLFLIVAASIVAGCQSKAPPPPVAQAPAAEKPAAANAPTNIPANISHGEARVGTAVDSAPVQAEAPPRATGHLVSVRLEVRETTIQVAKGVLYKAWTFGGRAPGPVIRVTQGDSVDFTLINRASMPHSMDFHAAQIAPNKYYTNVNPNDSIHYRFAAEVPGVFMYHCGTAPVAAHIANGMYGALIVDPRTPRPRAKELVFVQSEFYMSPDSIPGARSLAWDRLLSLAPDFVTFNGRAAQYAEHPITVKTNELVRMYVVNAGPNRFASFHVVGGIFERVFVDGSQASALVGVQTVAVPVGGASIFEIRLKQPGEYPFVTHAFADATKGAVGVLKAGNAGDAPPEPSTMKH